MPLSTPPPSVAVATWLRSLDSPSDVGNTPHTRAGLHPIGNNIQYHFAGLVILLNSYLSTGEGPLLPPRGGAPAEFSRKMWTPGSEG
ncbi:hypothetical protein PDIG_71060 [Penicillium digitatum PHI26]|uniref:Uncharacterized protein n=2 Tax=Penicillium digitatum TaxID=36651 RepID=K9FF10_PEND2|nr:hypothetical protein PDIP_80380 [Penicillium digitatum Pd1]EKV06223.1 hypothetical protein PDIP_80380 [Penicillium digitatum Pd1]EKV08030.1 hypothetical protein PDIG_71060 [Penicillium digitatum PHI26]